MPHLRNLSTPSRACKTLHAADDEELTAIAEHDAAMAEVPMEADVPDGVMLPMTDKTFLLRL